MIIDVHNHIGVDRDKTSQTVRQLKLKMSRYGINKAVIFPFNEPRNDLVDASINLLEYQSHSIIPFLRFNPKIHKSEEIRRVLRNYSFKGVKLHPFSQKFDPTSRRYYPIYKVIENEGVPLLIHTLGDINHTHPYSIAKLARDFKGLTIILAHFAGFSQEAIKEVGRRDNLYLETSVIGTPRVIEMVTERIGADKIIFGSDSPYSDSELELLSVKRARITNSAKEKILHRNISKILGIA